MLIAHRVTPRLLTVLRSILSREAPLPLLHLSPSFSSLSFRSLLFVPRAQVCSLTRGSSSRDLSSFFPRNWDIGRKGSPSPLSLSFSAFLFVITRLILSLLISCNEFRVHGSPRVRFAKARSPLPLPLRPSRAVSGCCVSCEHRGE